jgi:hypothetical protein
MIEVPLWLDFLVSAGLAGVSTLICSGLLCIIMPPADAFLIGGISWVLFLAGYYALAGLVIVARKIL